MAVDIRPLSGEAEFGAFLECDAICFGDEVRPERTAAGRAFLEFDRTLAAFDGADLVGTCANLSMELTVPGPAVVPCAGVTYVSVLPTHHRRGLLRAMMARLLDDAADRGEPVAALLAAESVIYGRFGFGSATEGATYEIAKSDARFERSLATGGTMRMLMPGQADTVLPGIHDANRRRWPGGCRRSAGWWEWHLLDLEADRDGLSRMYHVVHEPPGGGPPDGYLTWRIEHHDDAVPASVAVVVDHSAPSEPERLALLEFACRIDLIDRIRFLNFPVDEPLRWTLVDPRRLQTKARNDILWVRVLDVAAALEARHYGVDGRIVLEVEDPFRPASGGRFVLEAGEHPSCRPGDEEPDIVLEAADLGALYLGGVSAATLEASGRLRGRAPGAVARASRMFATERAPFGDTDF